MSMVILLDNGHGIETPGKRSPDGKFREYKYCREIAEAVEKELQAQGYDARRIVTEESDVKLTERVKRVNKICDEVGKNNVLLVSIHNNAAGMGTYWMKARGWCCFIYSDKAGKRTKKLAQCLYDVAKDVGLKVREYIKGQAYWASGFYIIKYTKCSAVLTENLFQDNKADVEFLMSEKGKQAIIDVHVRGIIKYLKYLEADAV